MGQSNNNKNCILELMRHAEQTNNQFLVYLLSLVYKEIDRE
jgi:hypothetical protein